VTTTETDRGEPDDLDREIEAFFRVERLLEMLAGTARPPDVPPPGGEPPAALPPGLEGVRVRLWIGGCWLATVVATACLALR
jgi:hypothetical protein